jgi:RNA polymerase sigma-70 factor (ECF subfamily)
VQLPAAAHAAHRDQDIADMLQDGAHAAAFAALVDRYESKIYRLCCSLLRDRGLAEDAAQESLLRIWKALDKYDQRASLSTWIYAITRNRCLTAIERRRVAESLDDENSPLELETAEAEPTEVDDQATLLRELVDALPDRYRRALTLYYYEERSVGEAALMLGVPEGTLKTNLFRARALLLERIRQLGLADPVQWLDDA